MPKAKLQFVDALRGIAACYVAMFHLQFLTWPHAVPPPWLEPFADVGMSGVSLFFIVSAFTLCISSASRRDEAMPIRAYYLRRFFRIAPLFYLWIGISCLRDYELLHTTHSAPALVENFLFVFNFSPKGVAGIPWAAWTIGVEMVFYVVFPLIFHVASTLTRAAVFLLLSLLAGLWWRHAMAGNDDFATFGILSRLPIFALGIVVYQVYLLVLASKAWWLSAIGYALVCGSAAAFVAIAYMGTSSAIQQDYQQALCWSGMVLGLSITPISILVNPLTRALGQISYSIYLTHATAWHLLSPLFALIYAAVGVGTAAYLLSYGAGMAVVVGVSCLTYRFVEQPGIRLGSRAIRYLGRSGVGSFTVAGGVS